MLSIDPDPSVVLPSAAKRFSVRQSGTTPSCKEDRIVSRKPVKSGRAPERSAGFKIQPRDERIVWFAGTHGLVTMPHIKLFAFEGRSEYGFWESVSEPAVYRRLKRLCDAGFLEHQRT
jgi:hypothetical protein